MGGRLPSLDAAQVRALLDHFAPGHRRKGNNVLGRGRDGRTFSIHLAHDGGMRPDILSNALRYVGVSREEFEDWMRGR